MVKIAIFDKNIPAQTNSEKYILNQGNYSLLFFSNKLKLNYRSNVRPQNTKFKKIIKSIFSNEVLKKDLPLESSTFLILKFNNFNEESTIEYKNDKSITYTNIYNNIDMSYYLKNEKLECIFILKDDCVPKDINISLDENAIATLDENKNLFVKINDFNILIRKTIFKGKEMYFTLDSGSIILKYDDKISDDDYVQTEIEEDFIVIEELNYESEIKENSSLFTNSIPEIYSEEVRTLLIPVKKSKFSYPYSKTTSLLCYPNFPVIESLFTSTEIKQLSYPIQGICDGQNVTGFIDYKFVELIPYISYSVALFNLQVDSSNNPIQDISSVANLYQISQISNTDIYAFNNDSFESVAFYLCQNMGDIPFRNVDFLVDLEIISGVTDSGIFLPIVTPVSETDDYYLYDINVKISVYKAPPVQIPPEDTQTQEALNKALGRPAGSTDPFTPGELESITSLNFSNNDNLDTTLLKYTPNLTYLDISNCNLDNLDTYYLQTLQSLIFLNISNNNVSSLEMIKDIRTLKILNISGNNITDLSLLQNLTGLTILNASSLPSITTTDIESLDVILGNKIVDITPLAALTSLESLNLAGNLIEDITPLSSLVNLLKLDISENAISNISSLIVLSKLSELYAQNQVIYIEPLYPVLDNNFILDLNFLKDIDNTTPCIDYVSDGGHCYEDDSCDCLSILWKDILEDTYAKIGFSHDIISSDISNFSGTINVLLKHPLL